MVWDVVVVGGELCGLAAAALLALARRRVVVIEDGDDGCAHRLGDRNAPVAPTLWRLPATGAAVGVLDALGLKNDARRVLGESGGLGIIDDPDLRILVSPSEDGRLRELVRAFGDVDGTQQAQALGALRADRRNAVLQELACLHEDGWLLESRRAGARVRAYGALADVDGDDDDVKRLGNAGLFVAGRQLAPFVQWRGDGHATGLAGFIAATHLQTGVPVATRGGLGVRPALRALLLDVLRQHGGEFLSDRVQSLRVEGKRCTLLQTAGRQEIQGRAIVDATVARDLVTRAAASPLTDRWRAAQDHVEAVADGVSVRWLLPARVLPRGLAPMSLVLREPPARPMLVGVYAGAALVEARGSVLDEAKVCVVASTHCGGASTQAAAAAVEDQLDSLLPFARGQVAAKDELSGAGVASALCGFVVRQAEHPLFGRRPRLPLDNIFRAGRDLAPAFGVDGELVAARSVASLVEKITSGSGGARAS